MRRGRGRHCLSVEFSPAGVEVLQQRISVVYGSFRTGRRGTWRRVTARRTSLRSIFPSLLAAAALAGCAVGPDYKPAPAPVPTHFKELKGWKLATPSDALDRGDWWQPYRDPKLAFLLRQVEVSNQNVAAQAAAYEQARALIRQAQANLFPVITANYNATRTHTGGAAASGGGGGGGIGGGATNTSIYTAQLSG